MSEGGERLMEGEVEVGNELGSFDESSRSAHKLRDVSLS